MASALSMVYYVTTNPSKNVTFKLSRGFRPLIAPCENVHIYPPVRCPLRLCLLSMYISFECISLRLSVPSCVCPFVRMGVLSCACPFRVCLLRVYVPSVCLSLHMHVPAVHVSCVYVSSCVYCFRMVVPS